MTTLWERLAYLEDKVYSQTEPEITQYEVSTLEELDTSFVYPPAIAYVRETGEYYRKFLVNENLHGTPYMSGRNGWFALDVSTPRFDRQIFVTKYRWVRTANFTQDLDYMNEALEGSGIWEGGIPEDVWYGMPQPTGAFDTFEDALPGDLVLRLGLEDPDDPESELKPEDNKWYIISVEVLDHGDSNHTTRDKRVPMCWNVMFLTGGNPPSRFDRVIHRANSDEVFDALSARGKAIPGDFVFRDDLKIWYYLLPPLEEGNPLLEVEIGRHITVKNKARFLWLTQDFDLKHVFVINLTHEKQNWERTVPTRINENWTISTATWKKKHYPADFCYWGNDNDS